MHRHRLLGGALALAIAAQAQAQPVQTCPVDGFDATVAARANGFQFARLSSNATSCAFENASIIVAAPGNREATCRFRVFAGQRLAPGWTLHRVLVEFSPEDAEVAVNPLPRGKLLVATVPRGKTGLFTIRRIQLRGADCDKWRDAFG